MALYMSGNKVRELIEVLEQAGLPVYVQRLLDEGFNDLQTLRDLREDDMIQLGIRAKDRELLHNIIEQLRRDDSRDGMYRCYV